MLSCNTLILKEGGGGFSLFWAHYQPITVTLHQLYFV